MHFPGDVMIFTSKNHKQNLKGEKYMCVLGTNMLKRSTIVEGYIIMENTFRTLVMEKEYTG